VNGGTDSSGITSFEVKPTWINGRTIVASAAAAVGVAAVLGFGWRKGYLGKDNRERSENVGRKEEDPS